MDSGPSVVFLWGIQGLYHKVQSNPGRYPRAVRARILTSLQYASVSLEDQRVRILMALDRLNVPC